MTEVMRNPRGFPFFLGDPMHTLQLMAALSVIGFIGFIAVGMFGAAICDYYGISPQKEAEK